MRILFPVAAVLLLGACASSIPAPEAGDARIEMKPRPGELLMAERLDGKRLSDGRYFEVKPGAHHLQISYRYQLSSDQLATRDRRDRVCYIELDYDNFRAGQDYQLVATDSDMQAKVWLIDAKGKRVAEGHGATCGY